MVSANIPTSTRKAVYRRDGYRCILCDSAQYIQIHHVVPRSEGGSDFPENLVTLCSRCHGQAHGIDVVPGIADPDTVEQACVEYLADMYTTDDNGAWYPFK